MAAEDVDEAAFEDLPNTDVAVEAHVHFGMTGSFPLRIAELFFADDGLYIAEYAYITPMFGLGARKHRREASAMQAVYDVHGLDEVLLQADTVVWHSYENLDRVVLHDGGWLGRPKIAVYPAYGASHAYRLHDDADPDDIAAEVRPVVDDHGVTFERHAGVGFDPFENVGRFFGRA
ncbi:hypothetical protein ACFQH6_00895 [Halobacteriaceae archaeon GCM10025711]